MSFTDFYCDPVSGSDMNGGGIASGAEPSAAASYTSTNGNWNSATGVFTPGDGSTPASTVNVGDFAGVYIDGATAPVFIARVTAVAAGANGAITTSTTAASGTAPTTNATARTIKVGGRLKGPNAATGHPFNFITNALTNSAANNPRVNLKNNGTYSITAAIASSKIGVVFQGYTTTAGDGGRATIDGGSAGASYNLLQCGGSGTLFVDLVLQNNGATGSAAGLNISSQPVVLVRVTVTAVRGHGFSDASGNSLSCECEASACNQSNTAATAGFAAISSAASGYVRCVSHNNSGSNTVGFIALSGSPVVCTNCIADSNGSHGFQISSSSSRDSALLDGCDSYNNGGDGINLPSTGGTYVVISNCNLVKNAGYGVNASGGPRGGFVYNCGFGSSGDANTSGNTNALDGIVASGSVTYSSPTNPWNAPATGDFTITAAAAKSAGRGAFTESTNTKTGTAGTPSIGAAQAAASGLKVHPGMAGGARG